MSTPERNPLHLRLKSSGIEIPLSARYKPAAFDPNVVYEADFSENGGKYWIRRKLISIDVFLAPEDNQKHLNEVQIGVKQAIKYSTVGQFARKR